MQVIVFIHTKNNLIQNFFQLWSETASFSTQVRTELKKKLCSWRQEAQTVCCGQWLAVFELQGETLSIATVPERNRSSATPTRALSVTSPNPDSSQMFRHVQILPSAPRPDVSLLHCPALVDQDNTLQHENPNDNGQSSAAMQVSFVIHLQDPVELLPNVVNIVSD